MVYLAPLKCDFKKIQPRHAKISRTQIICSILLKINILCVEFLNCFTIKYLTNLTDPCLPNYVFHQLHFFLHSIPIVLITLYSHHTFYTLLPSYFLHSTLIIFSTLYSHHIIYTLLLSYFLHFTLIIFSTLYSHHIFYTLLLSLIHILRCRRRG